MSEIVILDNDRGKTVAAHVGDVIVIRLAENPTTGYRWEMGTANNQLIELQSADYQVAPGTGVGGGGIRTFHLRTKAMGMVPLQLKLRRSWKSEDSAIDQLTVNIQIQ